MPPPSQIEITCSALPRGDGASASAKARGGSMAASAAPAPAWRKSRRFMGGVLAAFASRDPDEFAAVDDAPDDVLVDLSPGRAEPRVGGRTEPGAGLELHRDGGGLGAEV